MSPCFKWFLKQKRENKLKILPEAMIKFIKVLLFPLHDYRAQNYEIEVHKGQIPADRNWRKMSFSILK